MPGSDDPGDSGVSLGVADEWKDARTVVNNADAQLLTLRQYGFTIVSGLLAAQGLIEFPLAGASDTVPDVVKLAILISTILLILGLFDLDLRTRSIQRAAAHRACMLEGKNGLTKMISASYKPHPHIASVDVLYLNFVAATTVLGVTILAPSPFAISLSFLGSVSVLAGISVASMAAVYHYSKRVKGGIATS